MTRRVVALLCTVLAVTIGTAPATAFADPTSGCMVTDSRITEGSGLLSVPEGFRIVNDGGDTVVVYRLDAQCQVTGVTTAAIDPFDVEDLAIGPDGSLWVADLGDNTTSRANVAVVVLPDEPGQVTGILRRLTYPDGPHDAESLLVDDSGRAVVITKTFSGAVGIYRSVEPLDLTETGSSDPQPMENVGALALRQTGTAGGPVGPPVSNLMTTGAAQCADRVVLRTYTDLYVWQSTGEQGDPVVAMTSTSPVVIAAPAHAQGESVAITADCLRIFAHGEGVGVPIEMMPTPPVEAQSGTVVGEEPNTSATSDTDSTIRFVIVAGGIIVLAAIGVWWSVRRARQLR